MTSSAGYCAIHRFLTMHICNTIFFHAILSCTIFSVCTSIMFYILMFIQFYNLCHILFHISYVLDSIPFSIVYSAIFYIYYILYYIWQGICSKKHFWQIYLSPYELVKGYIGCIICSLLYHALSSIRLFFLYLQFTTSSFFLD